MIFIVKIEKLFISYTRFFLDILIHEDGAHNVAYSVSIKLLINSAQHPARSKNSQVSENYEKKKYSLN